MPDMNKMIRSVWVPVILLWMTGIPANAQTSRSVPRSGILQAIEAEISDLLEKNRHAEPNGDITASQVAPSEAELVPAVAPLDPAQAIRYYGAMNERVATVPAQPVDRGALKQLSQKESFALSRRLYRTRTDSPLSKLATDPRTRPVVQRGKARPVHVSF